MQEKKLFNVKILYGFIIGILFQFAISIPLFSSNLPPIIAFRINEGNQYTNQTEISLEIKSMKLGDSLIAEMKIGLNPSLNDVPWVKYSTDKINLILSEGDGEKTIYAQLRDIAGNMSPIESSKIILDTTPPQDIQISINNDEKYSGDEKRRVLIYIRSTEEDLEEMIFSNKSDFSDSKWEKMAGTKKWSLDGTGGDGDKTVYAKFKDRAGNISPIISDDIILDTQPPEQGSIVINNDSKFTKDNKIVLKIHANDAAMVRIVSSGKSETFPYEVNEGQEIEWSLDSVEGTKVVRVYFMDEAKNRTTTVIQDDIIFDRSGPPPPKILINGDKRFTNHKDGKVNIRLSTRVNPQTVKLMISNQIDFADAKPQNFRDIINNWQLPAEEDGMKTIYAKLIDEAGNHSEIAQAKVILDRTPPKVIDVNINDGSAWATSVKVNINMDVQDVSHMQINNTNAISNMEIWERFEPTKVDWSLIPGDGPKTVYMRFKDESNNISEVVNAMITLDTKPPTGEITINEGSKFVNSVDKLVNIKIITEEGKGYQITNKPDFTDIKLEPFMPEIKNWVLDGEDGVKTVFLRLRDEAGNFSNVITSSIILDRQPPTELNMIINEGNEWLTNSARKAAVQLTARGASHFIISEDPEFTGLEWETFKNVTTWVFSEEEEEKELFAKFKDPAGNISQLITDKIKLDYSPPICEEFVIEDGSDFCNNSQKKVILKIKAPDAVKMAISNNPISDPTSPSMAWEEYMEEKEWTLDGEDGLKTIYLVLQDEAGNYSGRYSDRIILDRVGPTNPTVIFNANQKFVQPGARKVPLELSAEGADKVFITEDANFEDGRWELFVPKKVFEVSDGDGLKNIYIKFRDKAMNETDVITGSVTLDTKPPEALSFTINKGEKFTNSKDKKVTMKIEASDATEMKIVQQGQAPGNWEPYSFQKEYILLGDDGEKQIGIAFRDEAGNITKPLNSAITLDRIPPKPENFVIGNGQGWTNDPDKKVDLQIKAEGAYEMAIGTDPTLKSVSWEPYNTEIRSYVLPGDDGEKIIFIRFRDEAGNESAVISSKVNLKRSF
jgi:tRNA threonylcarbamoyladenosine modification (KEOPS) complex  Pcc1 subunit